MASFKSVVCAVSEQCQEIKQSLALFPYFETWDSDLIAECCRVSSVAEFPPEEIILGPDVGNSHSVYFVLEGVCKVIQNIYVEVKKDPRAGKLFKLYRFPDSKKLETSVKNEVYSSRLFNHNYNFVTGERNGISNNFEETKNSGGKNEFLTETETTEEEKPGALNEQVQGSGEKPELDRDVPDESCIESNSKEINEMKSETTENLKRNPFTDELPVKQEVGKTELTKGAEPDSHFKVVHECKEGRNQTGWGYKTNRFPEKPKGVKSFFIQIGLIFKGACFGLEKSEKQYYMSETKVKCLKIPQRFLLQHNPCNIWNRIRLFHSLYFPKDEKIIDCLVSDRRWMERKKKQTEQIFYSNNLTNFTLVSDVPYSLRLRDTR